MTAIKSFTDLQQSKKLAEILPIESADMAYCAIHNIGQELYHCNVPIFVYASNKDIPCWSLAALYNILPNNEKETTTLSRGGWNIEPIKYLDNWWCEYEDESHSKDFTISASNSVDTCYETILKLHELNLL